MAETDARDHPVATNHREIDWSTAEVRDRALKVELTGDPSSDWKHRLKAVLDRLHQPGHVWGRVRPTKRYLKVADVPVGHEAELRFMLDAAVQQTNADLSGRSSPPPADVSEVDQRMTEAFRTTAEPPAES
jgi:hypothetical protein